MTDQVLHTPPRSPDNEHGQKPSKSFFSESQCKSIDLEFINLRIDAEIEKKQVQAGKKIKIIEKKNILNGVSGTLRHGTFTAIMGPSGSGKTTLLNFLSARIDSKLKIRGDIKVNSNSVNDIEHINNLVAFVQQDDILMATITPREIFNFTANLRLNLPAQEKHERVEMLLHDLGLMKCADTKVGNALIRGLSGGERKRASIGVELITNPSLVFLDEPTTGLDSTTALKILELLVKLAKSGRNIVSTIHQPNSEIFSRFDNLLLLVRGNIIYEGPAKDTVAYFDSIGYPCPKLTNPADYFMKIMNETGFLIEEMQKAKEKGTELLALEPEVIEKNFQERVNIMINSYKSADQFKRNSQNLLSEPVSNPKQYETSWLKQFWLITIRAFQNELRNPLDVKMKALQSIVFGIVVIILWNQMGHGYTGIQDRNGVLFMLATISSFGSIQGSLGTFSLERPVFIRERLSKSYYTSAYFWGRSASEFPFLLLFPILTVSIVYWVIGLNTYNAGKVILFYVIHIMTWFAGSGYGLLISTAIPKIEVAMAMVPILLVPLLAMAGFFVNQNNIPYFFYPFEYISTFKYAFQASAINEFTNLELSCQPECNPLADDDFHESFAVCLICLAAIGVGMRLLAYIGLIKISTPKKAVIIRDEKPVNS